MPTSLLETRLTTGRLTLRAPAKGDVADLVSGIGSFAVAKMLLKVPHPYFPADAAQWIAGARSAMAAGTELALVVVAEGRAIGCVGMHELPDTPRLGYWLAEDHWGRGLATEASAAVLEHTFSRLGASVIHSGVFADNTASLRVQEKLGFSITGQSMAYCLARAAAVPHIDTRLERSAFRANR